MPVCHDGELGIGKVRRGKIKGLDTPHLDDGRCKNCNTGANFPTGGDRDDDDEAHLLLVVVSLVTYRSCATGSAVRASVRPRPSGEGGSAAFMARTGFECNRKNRSAA